MFSSRSRLLASPGGIVRGITIASPAAAQGVQAGTLQGTVLDAGNARVAGCHGDRDGLLHLVQPLCSIPRTRRPASRRLAVRTLRLPRVDVVTQPE